MRLLQAFAILILTAALLGGCARREEAPAQDATSQPATRTAPETDAAFGGAARPDGEMTPEEIAQQRRDQSWRQLLSFRQRQQRARRAPAAAQPANVRFNPSGSFNESLENVNWQAIDQLPVSVPMDGDAAGPSVLKAQVLLDRSRFFPGVIDGQWGKNTAIAVHFFQEENGIEPTGVIDQATYRALASNGGNAPLLTSYSLTQEDLKGPFVEIPDDVYEQEKLDCLCYESAGEMLAEKFHTTIDALEMLNPGTNLSQLSAGQRLLVPNVDRSEQLPGSPSRVLVSIQGNYLHAFGQDGSIIMHAPTTVGSEYDPSPSETLKITAKAFDPTFHYQPKLFHEVPDDEEEALLQPGPNSPVGKVWIQLSKENYGIHGTSDPSSIGYASSHGCIRLTNWNAMKLGRSVPDGTEVEFTDAR